MPIDRMKRSQHHELRCSDIDRAGARRRIAARGLLAGCGASHARFTPTSGEARSSLEAALTAWRDGKPYGPVAATPPVQVADSAWQAGQQVESFEIGDEEDDGDGTKQFVVKLKMKKPRGRPVRPLFCPWPRPGLGLPRRGLQADAQHG